MYVNIALVAKAYIDRHHVGHSWYTLIWLRHHDGCQPPSTRTRLWLCSPKESYYVVPMSCSNHLTNNFLERLGDRRPVSYFVIGSVIMRDEHYSDVMINAVASQITSIPSVYSTVYSGADQRKYQSSASLAFVRGIHRWPVNSPHKGPVTRNLMRLSWIWSKYWKLRLKLATHYLVWKDSTSRKLGVLLHSI